MYQKTIRPLTETEIQDLNSEIDKYKKQRWITWQRALVVVVSFFAFPYLVTLSSLYFVGPLWNMVGGIGALVCIIAFFAGIGGWRRQYKEAQKMIRNIRYCIKKEVVEVERIQSEEVATLESYADGEPTFLFQVEEAIIWSSARMLFDQEAQMPNSNFEILSYGGFNGPVLTKFNYVGEVIEPKRIFSSEEQAKLWETAPVYEPGFFKGSIEEMMKTIIDIK